MATDLDIVGSAGVDIVPVVPQFHDRLKAAVLPASDRVGEDIGRRLGDAISRHITVDIPDAVNAGGRRARVAATQQGGQVGGALGRAVREKLEEAFRSLPKANVRLGDTGVNADIDRLRAKIESLSNKTIGIDLDEGEARVKIAEIDAALARLASENPSVQVRTDTAAARAALAAVQAQIDEIDHDDVRVKVHADTGEAQAALFQLGVALAGVAAIPAIPVLAAGIGSIASAALAAGAGVGALALVAVPAFKNITSVIQAKTAAEKDAAKATDNSAASNVKAAQNALTMAGAEAQLASAHRQASQAISQANQQVTQAERSLTQAQQAARDAQEALTQARKDAADQLAALDDKLADGKLSQRDAALQVQQAEENLQKVQKDPTATELQRQQAQLALDQALQSQKEQSKSYIQLQKDAEAQKKAGVEGSDEVKQAKERLAEADQKVADQEQAVADARAKVRDAEIQGAEQVASAERSLESARLSSIDTTSKATSAADTYRAALAKLTPEQRKLYDSIAGPNGLTAAFKDWSKSLQPDVLPLFTRGVNGAKSALPGLTPIVKSAADAIRDLMDRASAQLKSPFWRGFKRDIESSAKPAIVGLGVAFGNVLKGMAGVVDAFLPHMDGISSTLQRITAKFANWGSHLKGSPAFEHFLQYADEHGPGLVLLLEGVANAALQIGAALAPLSGPVLSFLTGVANTAADVAKNLPWAVQALWGLYVAQKAIRLAAPLWAVAMTIYTFATAEAAAGTWTWAAALQATGIIPIIEAIIVVIIALAVGVYEAYKHVGWFHDAVNAAFTGIKIAVMFVWDHALKPMFSGLWTAIKAIGDVLVWLWKNIFVPAWNGIVFAMKIAIAVIAVVLIAPLVIAFRLIGKVVSALWTDFVKPTWHLIGELSKWLWDNYLEPFFNDVWDIIKWVGDKFVWLYDHAIKPAAGWIADKAKWLWEKGIKPALTHIWDGIKWVGDKFQWLYDHSVGPIFGWIADKAKWLYNKGIKPQFDKIKDALKLVSDGFKIAKDAIKEAWDDVKEITKGPVNFVIDMVYTHGIKAVWDKVAGFVGLDKLPKAPKLLAAGGTIGDGWGTARPMKTNRPTAIVGEGNPRFPEFVIPTDPKYRSRAKSLWHAAGTQLLASGGILGSAWDWTKDTVGGAVSKGVDWAKKAGDLISDPSKIWAQLMKPLLDKATKRLDVAQMGKVLLKYPFKMADGLKDKIISTVAGGGGSGGDIGGTIPSGQRREIISQALAAAHVPPPGTLAQWLAGMNTLITRESGWNPNAINLWDSNAAAGHPSQGLTQTIPSTWSAYVPDSLRSRGILDPVGNVAASVRYIVSRYGNITNVQQANANKPPMGYDSGGWLMPGFTTTYNGTGKPEAVFTNEQWADIRASKSATTSPTEVNADVHVYVGDREITDIVRTEIHTRETENATALNTGRWI